MRPLVLALLPLALGCRADRVFGTSSDLALGAQRVQFPRTFVGHPTHAQLEIRNGGRTNRTVRLKTVAPFATEPGPLEVPGGSSLQVELTFAPQSPGPA